MKRFHDIRESVKEMRTCHEMGKWLQHYLDGELDPTTSGQVRDHLLTCVRCGLEFDTYRRIVDVMRRSPQDPTAVKNDEVAAERLRDFAEQLAHADAVNEDDDEASGAP